MTYPKIVLLGEPKSTQHIYGILCKPYPTIYLKREGKAIKEVYFWQAKSQWKQPLLDVPFGMNVRFYHKTKRKLDIDNFFKLFFDSCNRVIWADDNLIQQMNVTKCHDTLSPRIELEIFDLP